MDKKKEHEKEHEKEFTTDASVGSSVLYFFYMVFSGMLSSTVWFFTLKFLRKKFPDDEVKEKPQEEDDGE